MSEYEYNGPTVHKDLCECGADLYEAFVGEHDYQTEFEHECRCGRVLSVTVEAVPSLSYTVADGTGGDDDITPEEDILWSQSSQTDIER